MSVASQSRTFRTTNKQDGDVAGIREKMDKFAASTASFLAQVTTKKEGLVSKLAAAERAYKTATAGGLKGIADKSNEISQGLSIVQESVTGWISRPNLKCLVD